jgi:hypothetical protein
VDGKTKNELDRLLAGDRIGGPEADAILERVLATVERDERRSRRWLAPRFVVAGGALAAAAAALLLIRPADEGREDELRARGAAAAAVQLEAVCSEGTLAACPRSSKLIFVVSGAPAQGFLSAYAEPVDAAMPRIWYFSREAGSPQLASAGDETRVFEHAVRLSETHPAGRYRVHAHLSDRPLGREELLASPGAQIIRASMRAELVVIED